MAALSAILRFKLSRHQPADGLEALARDIAQASEVLFCFEIAGEYDWIALVSTADMTAYNAFIDRVLRANPILVRYETSFIKRRMKFVTADGPLDIDQANFAPGAATAARDYPEALWVNHDNGLVRLATADIERVTAEGDYMRLHIGERSWLLHSTITQLLDQLDPARFIRLHRSAIVRRDRVLRLEHEPRCGWFAHLEGGARQRIAKSHVEEAMAIANRTPARRNGGDPSERNGSGGASSPSSLTRRLPFRLTKTE